MRNPTSSEVEDYLHQHLTFPAGESGDQRMARCPQGHLHKNNDRNPSLSVNLEKGLLKCFGCDLEGHINKLWKELSWEEPPWLKKPKGPPSTYRGHRVKEWYPYEDRLGRVKYWMGRIEYRDSDGHRKKQFCLYNAKGYWSLKGTSRVLYRLPELLKAKTVWIVEGEKDVHTLGELGLTATTSPFGAGKWRDEYSQYFNETQSIVIIPDNDDQGRKHAQQVAKSLFGKVASLKVVELSGVPEGGDVTDWFQEEDPDEL